MSVARNVAEGCSSLKNGKWERSQFTGIELKGKTLGIIGAGKGKQLSISVFQISHS
jgi:D-3-phosphoglycerate dehydrogenase